MALTETSKRKIGEKNSIHQKGRLWYNNGEIELHLKPEEIPPKDFKRGRLPMSEEQRQKLCIARRKRVISDETRKKVSQTMKGHYVSPETCKKISQAKTGFKYSEQQRKHLSDSHKGIYATEEAKEKNRQSQLRIQANPELRKAKLEKTYKTHKEKNSFNSSQIQDDTYKYLISKFGSENVLNEYRDERYPFNCDFYIKNLDLFIELNLHWTHGKHPYNEELDKETLNSWLEKAKTSRFYEQAINTWTVRDVKKIQTASDNKLNYLLVYNINELYNYIKEKGF